jgi:hypothetical protein
MEVSSSNDQKPAIYVATIFSTCSHYLVGGSIIESTLSF